MGIIQVVNQILVSRAQKKVIDTSRLRTWLQSLRENSISVDEFVSAYSARDSNILQLFHSFDGAEEYRQYLKDQIRVESKYDFHLGDVVNIDSLVRHEGAHREGAAKYGVNTKYIFFNFPRDECGGMAVTTNLVEVAKGWDLKQFEMFWHDFVITVHKNPELEVEHRTTIHYAHPIYSAEFSHL